MPGETTLKIMIDAELKAQAEALYSQLGTSFAEAIRIFAQQSVQEKRCLLKCIFRKIKTHKTRELA